MANEKTVLEQWTGLLDQRNTKLLETLPEVINASLAKRNEETHAEKKEEIEHEQLKGLLEVKIMGMPLGQAFVGGSVALLVTELVAGLVAPRMEDMMGKTWGPALLKGGTAWAVKQWGPGLIGKEAANVASLFLVWDAVRSLIPIDEWIKKLFAKKETTSTSSEAPSSESSSAGNGHQSVDAMDTLRLSLAGGK